MKKSYPNRFLIIFLLVLILSATSCATILGGTVNECQRTKPAIGDPSRKIRTVALIADIVLFWPGAVIDFATGAIYKPCETLPPRMQTMPRNWQ